MRRHAFFYQKTITSSFNILPSLPAPRDIMRVVPWFRLCFLVVDDGQAVRETRFGSSSGSEARGMRQASQD